MRYMIKCRHMKSGKVQIVEFDNINDFMTQLHQWLDEDKNKVGHETYLYECYMIKDGKEEK